MIIATGCAALIAAVLTLIWAMQRRLMYFPTADVATLDDVELADVELVTFETTDGLRLGGWFVRASGPPPHVTVLVFNGNAGNRSHRGPIGGGAPSTRFAGAARRLSGLWRKSRDADGAGTRRR